LLLSSYHTYPLFPYTTLFRSAKFWSSHDCPTCSAAHCSSSSAMAITTSGRWLDTPAKNEEPSNEVGRAGLIVLQNPQPGKTGERSEEHTSELQSLRHLVCRLL